MLRWSRVLTSSSFPSLHRFPWLDSNGYSAFSSPNSPNRKGIINAVVGDMIQAESRIVQLNKDLKDPQLTDVKELVISDIETEESTIRESSEKIRNLIILEMDQIGIFDQDKLDARLEVRAGVGGDEALKWAQEIFEMYRQVSARMGWNFEIEDNEECMKALVSAPQGVYGYLKFESGVHRVQRVPFNSDRMQTSAAAVWVVPKIEVAEVKIRESDLKISISKKSSGAGGQSVNAAYQQVRMTHIPTGFTVVANESHAQQENRETALKKIKEKVQQMAEEKALAAMANARKGQVKTADRSEKVRSYNFQRSEVNDHRLGGVVKESCEEFMTDCASLVDLWHRLCEARQNELINQFLSNPGIHS